MKDKIVKSVLGKRSDNTHKGNYNKVLIYAGSLNYVGAAQLACRSALYSGVGHVILANNLDKSLQFESLPEVTYIKRDLKNNSIKNIKSILFGNGLDYPNKIISKDFALIMKEFSGKVIIDATGLKYFKDYIKENEIILPEIILTPHIKEFCELTDCIYYGTDSLLYKKAMEQYLEQYPKMVIMLKSYNVLIKTRRQERFINKPNSGFAHAGCGDMLAGLIAGLIAYNTSYNVDICYSAYFLLLQSLKKEEKKISSMSMQPSFILNSLPLVIKDYIN